jgi:hypothetical protein
MEENTKEVEQSQNPDDDESIDNLQASQELLDDEAENNEEIIKINNHLSSESDNKRNVVKN